MEFDPAFLRAIRAHELGIARTLLPPPPARVLEIAAGGESHAGALAEAGYDVVSLDVGGWIEDGAEPLEAFPFAAGSFPVLLSSALLPEVRQLGRLLAEARRVLAPGGVAVHGMSTSTWRLWTNVAHYPHAARAVVRKLRSLATPSVVEASEEPGALDQRPPLTARLARIFVPPPVGGRGSSFAELTTMSARAWREDFRRAGWRVLSERSSGIAYSGHMLLGARLGLGARRGLAPWIGSSSIYFAVEPDPDAS